MRIISRFKDFYDTALAMGADSRVTYVRHSRDFDEIPEEWAFMRPRATVHNSIRVGDQEISIRPLLVVFCGLVYHGVGVSNQKSSGPPSSSEDFLYTYESYTRWCDEHGVPLIKWPKSCKGKHSTWRVDPYYKHERLSLRYIEPARAWFRVGDPNKHREVFIEREVPIATCVANPTGSVSLRTDAKLEINGSLGQYQFYRVFDAYQAYQELDMFVAGVLSREGNSMVTIDDDSLRREKGFDCHSFRRAPTKRRPKECKE